MSAPQFFRLLCTLPCSGAPQRFHQAERFCRSGCAMRPQRSAQLYPQAASSWEDGLSSTRARSQLRGSHFKELEPIPPASGSSFVVPTGNAGVRSLNRAISTRLWLIGNPRASGCAGRLPRTRRAGRMNPLGNRLGPRSSAWPQGIRFCASRRNSLNLHEF